MAMIELDIFSGRPNPVWHLNDADLAELNRRYTAFYQAQIADLNEVLPLGYRGFLLHQGGSCVRIYHSQSIDPTTNRVLADLATDLEEWLLETGKAVLDPQVYQAARTALGLP